MFPSTGLVNLGELSSNMGDLARLAEVSHIPVSSMLIALPKTGRTRAGVDKVATCRDIQFTYKRARAIARKHKALQKSCKAARTSITKDFQDLSKA